MKSIIMVGLEGHCRYNKIRGNYGYKKNVNSNG